MSYGTHSVHIPTSLGQTSMLYCAPGRFMGRPSPRMLEICGVSSKARFHHRCLSTEYNRKAHGGNYFALPIMRVGGDKPLYSKVSIAVDRSFPSHPSGSLKCCSEGLDSVSISSPSESAAGHFASNWVGENQSLCQSTFTPDALASTMLEGKGKYCSQWLRLLVAARLTCFSIPWIMMGSHTSPKESKMNVDELYGNKELQQIPHAKCVWGALEDSLFYFLIITSLSEL